ncbi:S-layer homology domain-containing protein [Microcoleus sp. FACHB-SPT15]|uniref:S-layer homology domain-containing protein n=1 Tax=Microcoleus sp. FACHB-SPT15 TaxID=2692830 RepID=UPI00177ADF18|nr:S-layer homology domain-containing protein [Microcoleus sp. FACHB-SPT15]MBD1809132.1 S-layer homology domain-containing protein [Microcoleus sp. FACHB-SPT15]
MTNLPPRDPRSSNLGFDELIGVVVAFGVIGTILAVLLGQKDNRFGFEALDPSSTTTPTSPGVLISPSPAPEATLPTPIARETPSPSPTIVGPRRVGARAVGPLIVGAAPAAKAEEAEAPATPVKGFSDVPQDYWARPYIESLTQREVIAGYTDGTFRPDEPVTRAAFAAQLDKAFSEGNVVGTPRYTANYKDVANEFWASSAIRQATTKGFMRGYPGEVFRPQQEISKLQALLALNSGLDLPAPAAPNQVLQVYQDAAQIPQYATNAVAAATQAGIVVNHPNRQQLNPNILITRAEAAALIHQAMAKAGKVEEIRTDYVVKPQ